MSFTPSPQTGFTPTAAPAAAAAPSGFPATENKTAKTDQPTGDMSGALRGLAELFGTSLANIPGGALHGIHDIVSRATGNGPAPEYKPTFTPSPNAQAVGESIAGRTPQPYTVGDLLNQIPGVKEFHDQYIAPVKQDVGQIGAAAGIVAPAYQGLKAALPEAAAELPHTPLGLRTADEHQIAAGATGLEGQAALGSQNVAAATRVAGNQAGVPADVPVNSTSLAAARAKPGAVLDRAADELPTAPLSPAARTMVENAQNPQRILKGTPNVTAQTEDAQTRLLGASGEEPPQFSGAQIRAERTALRAEVDAGMNSSDADQRAMATYKNKLIQALDQHTLDTLPADSTTNPAQVKLARATLAQNYTVDDLMNGSNLNLKGLGKLHNDNPNLLTGDLRTLGQFAVDHPEVSALPESEYRFAKPGIMADIGKSIGGGGAVPTDIGSRLSKIFGVQAGARRVLLGPSGESMAAASSRPVTGLGGEFDAKPNPLAPEPAPPLSAGPMGAPPAAAGPPGQIPLANVLAHGVEQPGATGLTAGPMGTPAPTGIPFNMNAGHAAGGLELSPEAWLANYMKENNSDLAGVKSQGVPEDIVQRTAPQGPRPKVAHSPAFINQNASLGNPASDEGIASLKAAKAAGVQPISFGADDLQHPMSVNDIQRRDLKPAPDSIFINAKDGSLIDSGGMAPNLVRNLLARWKAIHGTPLGDKF